MDPFAVEEQDFLGAQQESARGRSRAPARGVAIPRPKC